MTEGLDHLDQWESAFERRSIGRTKIAKSALLFFIGQTGPATAEMATSPVKSVSSGFGS